MFGLAWSSSWITDGNKDGNDISLGALLQGIYGGLVGISLGLLVASSLLFWKRQTRNRPAWVLFLVALLNLTILLYFGLSTLSVHSTILLQDLCKIFAPAEICPIHTGILPVPWSVWFASFYACEIALIWISDAAIAYRAGILIENKLTRIVLCLLWFLSVVAGILVIHSSLTSAAVASESDVATYTSHFFVCFSVLCNVVSTGLFGSILWKHRSFLRMMGYGKPKTTPAQRVLAAVLESGVVYCAFQIAYALYHYSTPYRTDQYSLWQAIYVGFSGIYPALILLVTQRHRASIVISEISERELQSNFRRFDGDGPLS